MSVAVVKRKVVNGKAYFYLQHTVRAGRRVATREKYLGSKLPKDLEEVKARFLAEVYGEKWFPLLDAIRDNFASEERKLPKSAVEKQVQGFSVKFTYDSNRMEGGKLSLRETADLLERGLAQASKPVADVKEAEAHEKVFYEVLGYGKDLTLDAVLYWHGELFKATKPDIAGKVRGHQVKISGSKFLPPSPAEIPALLKEFFSWYHGAKGKLHPVELAALTHLKLVTIHPFADGNGRISRLAMNFVLHRKGFPLLSIPYENRGSYYHALERAQTKKNESVFVHWLYRRYVKEYGKYAKKPEAISK
ncbi:Fic/DOC family protein [uncultured archaeon]|nr:Fic/DOC family protein [uncultured archaeon]